MKSPYNQQHTHFQHTLLVFMTFLLLLPTAALAQFTSAPAFPGAEGYGRYTTGGRGGTVYHVTRLDDYIQDKDYSENYTAEEAIPGTLRYAVTRSGARTVVFDVAGTIELRCPLKIKNGDITILGQTAPGDGICLKNYTLGIDANNVIIRYIRCRMGDEGKRYYNSGSALTNTAFEDDAMNAYHKDGSECKNIIIDHCSISWCVDECGSFYGNKDFTLQWCILSESLRKSVHDKGNHGYGGIWGGEKASFHHNLLADHDSRNPRFDHGYVSTLAGPVDYTNNVLYNWGGNSAYGGENKKGYEAKKFNMINNYYRYGGATSDKDRLLNPTTKCSNCNGSDETDIVPGKFYITGNYMYGSSTVTNDNTCSSAIVTDSNMGYSTWSSNYKASSKFLSGEDKFNYNTISLHAAETTYNKVLDYAGASLSRDAVDTRICKDAKNGTTSYTTGTGKASNGSTGGLIDTPSDVGGYPTLTGTKATDTDGDGIPDEWEDAHDLNKTDASDALTKTLDSRGYYTNLEVYANYLVQHITKAERAGATESFEEYYPLDSDDPAPTQTVITASSENVNITGTANTTVTLSSNNSSGAYSITTQPDASVATASISGSTITITGVAAGSTSLTVTQAATTGYTSATKTINITVTAAQGGGDTPAAGTLTWDYTSAAPTGISSGQTTNTDKGLTYNGTVSDSDKNQLKGIKLNSSGYCYFTKDAVAGTLAITFGPRSGSNNASIKVYSYATTPSAETLIGTTETATSLETKTIALSATQNNIYLTRGESTETVITKIVFTPSNTPVTPTTYTVSATATNGSVAIKNGSTTVASGSAVDNGTSLTFTATPATGYKFTQWSDGNTENPRTVVVNGAAVSLTAQFTAKSTDATLSTLAAGSYALSPAFSANTTSYTCELPAGTSVVPTVTATKNNANASVNITQAPSTTGTATITVTAESGATKTYTIQFSVASSGEQTTLFSMEVTSSNTLTLDYQKSSSLADYATIEGGSATVYNGKNSTTAQNMVSGKAVNLGGSSGSYLHITLTSGNKFAADDVITITNEGKWNVSNTTSGATSITTPYTVKNTDAFVNGSDLYIFKTGETGEPSSIKSITITRGSNSGETPDDDDDVIEDPDPAPVAVMPAAKKGFDFVVGRDGDINAAIAAANRASGSDRYLIFVPDGTHNMTATQSWTLGSDKSAITGFDGTTVQPGSSFTNNATWLERSNVSIIGQSMDGTILKNKPNFPGISYTSTLEIRGDKTNTYIQDLTLYNNYANGANDKGVAVAFYDRGTNTIAKNLNAWSNQDTYTSAATRCYYETSTFAGTVDFICGSGDVWFEQCDLVINNRDGNVITAPSTAATEQWGYVFNGCTISKAEGATLVTDKNWTLGRPWKNAPASTFINTKMNVLPKDAAWTNMTNGLDIRFHEYGSTNSSGTLLDLSKRSVSDCKGATADKPVLTEAQASKYKVSNVLAGDNNWDPRALTLQVGVNNVQLNGSTLTWDNNDYALCWIVFKDGEYYANPITNSLELTEEGTYTVRAANAMGGLGEASTGVEYVDMSAGGAVLALTAAVQGGSNAAGSTINQETHYYNNWGTSGWAAQAYIGFDVTVPEGKQIKSATLKFTSYCGGSYDNRNVDVYLLDKTSTAAFNTNNMSLSAAIGRKVSTETDNRTESTKTIELSSEAIEALKEVATADATSPVIFQLGGAVAGATIYGKASAKAPTLDVEFEDIPATNIIWDFSEYTEQVTLNSSLNNTYSTEYTKDGMTLLLVGKSDGTSTSEYVKKDLGFRCNGTSNASIRYIKFTPDVSGVLMVNYISNKNDDKARTTAIGTAVGTPLVIGDCNAGEISAYLTAGTTYYIYFVSGGQTITRVEFDTTEPLTLAETSNYTTFTKGTYNVKLKKTFPAGKWTSLVLPFSATTQQLMEAFPNRAANTEIAVVKEMKNNTVYFTTQAKIDANVPVLIKVDQADITNDNTYTFTNVTVQNSATPNSASKDGIMMKGLYKRMGYNEGQVNEDRQHLYFVYNSKFYDWSYLDYMPPFSAYIYTEQSNGVDTSGAKAIIFMLGDEEATGVYTVNGYVTAEDDAVEFNTVGQRIGRTTKGLHISKGKKYFVK